MKYQSAITQVFIDLAAHQKLWAWTKMAKGEVSMLGLVEDTPDGPAVSDLFLTKQSCTQATTDMDQADVARLLFDLGSAGIEGKLRAWVHSHGTMDVFWSTTDDACIEGLAADPFSVSVVVNRKGDVRARVDVLRPVRFVIDDLPVKLRVPDAGLEDECRREFVAKVSEAAPFPGLNLPMNGRRPTFGMPGPDVFGGRRHHRPFAFLEVDEMAEAVGRGDLSLDEYLAATDGDVILDPFVEQEVADGRCP